MLAPERAAQLLALTAAQGKPYDLVSLQGAAPTGRPGFGRTEWIVR
jgi:hypothetical protein